MEKEIKSETDKTPQPYKVLQLGVWRVLIAKSITKVPGQYWKDSFYSLPLLRLFVTDIYQLAPYLFCLFIFTRLWSGIKTSILLVASNRLLAIVEAALTSGHTDINAILNATLTHLCYMVIVYTMEWWADHLRPRLQHKVIYHFEELLLRAILVKDLPTYQENTSNSGISADSAWTAFREIIDVFAEIFSIAAQLVMIVQLSRSNYGPIFAAFCIAKPVLNLFLHELLWSKTYIVHSNNDHHIRLRALHDLSKEQYKQGVISGDLAGYIIKEYAKARKALGDISDDWPEYQYNLRSTPAWDIFSGFISDLPMIYYAATAILCPSKFSVSSIAILQQSSTSLRYTFSKILLHSKDIQKHLRSIANLYEALKVSNQIGNGDLPYPAEGCCNDGMSLIIRNLSFQYPGSKSTRNALTDVSFSVKSGQLVVIVGTNGSGKSTVVKILNRLYNPTSGEILVDGQPMSSYQTSGLRQATADLSQDHHLYPLSIRENIGLGHTHSLSDIDLITKSADLGGALDFVTKLEQGFDTTLRPVRTAYMGHANKGIGHPLKSIFDNLEKRIDISGGEKQRLVASRLFMRLLSNKIKLVTVDEPSSALDPQAELELFQRLRDAKGGRTMIFVTHRFGHLTKHADQIICMKNGTVSETGTHKELMSKDGEYAKLYNIQAESFLSEASNNVDELEVEELQAE